MPSIDVEAALDLVFRKLPDEKRKQVVENVLFQLQPQPENTLDFLDPNLSGGGGAAFLWEDVLSLDDALGEVEKVPGLLDSIDVAGLGKLLVGLVGTWRRLRGVRVTLDENQFKVLRAVKQGHTDISAIAAATGLEADVAKKTVEELQGKKYKGDINLIEGTDGHLKTQF